MFTNLTEHTDNRPILYLGEAHTLLRQYTPSKQAILGNVRTALRNTVDSTGWFIPYRDEYTRTSDRCYDPFQPHTGELDDPSAFTAVTGSRDRFLWANLLLAEQQNSFDPDEKFDLWLYGHDFDFYEHRLSLRTADGDWEFIGDFSGYLDGEYPYATNGRDRAIIFHGLDRETFIDDETVALKIDSGSDELELKRIYVVPYLRTSISPTEREATALIEDRPVDEHAMGSWQTSSDAITDQSFSTEVSIEREQSRLEEVIRPEQSEEFRRMQTLESSQRAHELFDLWLFGHDLDSSDVEVALNDTSIAEYRDNRDSPSSADTQAVVYRGLSREEFFAEHSGGTYTDVRVTAEDASLLGIYVLPFHGATNFKSDSEVAATIRRDYTEGAGQIETFALGHQTWPGGVPLTSDDSVETWLHVPNRRAIGQYSG